MIAARIDELVRSNARQAVIRIGSGEGLAIAVKIAHSTEPVLLVTDAGDYQVTREYPALTRIRGLPIFVADMLDLPLGGGVEIVEAIAGMVEQFAEQHGRQPAALIVDPASAPAVDVAMLERGLRQIAARHGEMTIVLAGGAKR
jgi:hypothetical protein